MKKTSLMVTGLLLLSTPAYADVYVAVDADGNAVGGAIMCDAVTCSSDSIYSKMTLKEGEKYVLQGVGIHWGIGNNNPDTQVKVDIPTQTWTVTNTQTQTIQKVFTPEQDYTSKVTSTVIQKPAEISTTIISETSTTNGGESATVVSTTSTNVVPNIENTTTVSDSIYNEPEYKIDFLLENWWDLLIVWLNNWVKNNI